MLELESIPIRGSLIPFREKEDLKGNGEYILVNPKEDFKMTAKLRKS